MSNILDKIVAHKRKEVEELKSRFPEFRWREQAGFSRNGYSLIKSLQDPQSTGIIAEFKRCSPSKGMINASANPETVTAQYAAYGASGISVLTDQEFFRGSNEDLKAVRQAVSIPILRKDFVIDPYQITEAKAIGADVILLIAECLSREEVSRLARHAADLGLEVLLEMHSEEQLDKLCAEVTLVGVNNRDLKTFQVDIERSIRLARQLPPDMPKIAESGIGDPAVIVTMKKAGFSGFLMGEYFMKQPQPGAAFKAFAERIPEVSKVS
jgi:indole-3-glycerol phosphate synthase